MKNFIFYTKDGYTLSPNQTELENCQVLAFVLASDTQNAWRIFNTQHKNLISMGFFFENIVCAELLYG